MRRIKSKKSEVKLLIVICLFLANSANLFCQIDTMALKTPEGVAEKMLEFISFKKGEVKNWDEYRNLFLPNAAKFVLYPKEGNLPLNKQVSSWNIEEFVRYANEGYSRAGFEEYVIGLDVKEFNGVATVFQSFYCRTLDNSYESRGVNTYQLVFLNNRWWIASSAFTNETENNKLPDELLFSEYRSNSKDLTSNPTVKNNPDYDQVYNALENYILANYEADQSKIKMSVDTTLRKIGYWYDLEKDKHYDNLEMTYNELFKLSNEWNRDGSKADETSIRNITIFDVGEKTAVGKIDTVWGFDHFQLAKVNGTWKIINVIWEGKG